MVKHQQEFIHLVRLFGLADDPGSSKDYLKVNDNHYWVDDVNSKYYNKLVDIRKLEFNGVQPNI